MPSLQSGPPRTQTSLWKDQQSEDGEQRLDLAELSMRKAEGARPGCRNVFERRPAPEITSASNRLLKACGFSHWPALENFSCSRSAVMWSVVRKARGESCACAQEGRARLVPRAGAPMATRVLLGTSAVTPAKPKGLLSGCFASRSPTCHMKQEDHGLSV